MGEFFPWQIKNMVFRKKLIFSSKNKQNDHKKPNPQTKKPKTGEFLYCSCLSKPRSSPPKPKPQWIQRKKSLTKGTKKPGYLTKGPSKKCSLTKGTSAMKKNQASSSKAMKVKKEVLKKNMLAKLGKMTLAQKLRKAAEGADTEEDAANNLKGMLTKEEHSKAWSKHKVSMKGKERSRKSCKAEQGREAFAGCHALGQNQCA